MNKLNGELLELCDAEVPLPPYQFETRGLWIDLPTALRDDVIKQGGMFARGALHAIEHALIALAPISVLCESSELGCQCTRRQVLVLAVESLLPNPPTCSCV